MGRRSRKRRTVPAPAATPPGSPRRRSDPAGPPPTPHPHRVAPAEAPKAPWAPFPLVPLCGLVAIVLVVVGLLTHGSRRGALLACGIALASLAGLELAIREHVAGYRSHAALLAGAVAVAVVVPLYLLTGLPQVALPAVGVLVYTLGFVALRRVFAAKGGGSGVRV